MFEPKAHYLSYGSTDQETARNAVGQYSGILVPGTIAAYQEEGTSGFVSSFVSRHPGTRYSIDPRFPLFQQRLIFLDEDGNPKAKAAHKALARLLNDEKLVVDSPPEPRDFPNERLEALANRWHRFQTEYTAKQPSKFEKYAARLGEGTKVSHTPTPPSPLLPLYFVDLERQPDWSVLSHALYGYAQKLSDQYVPVVAVDEVRLLSGRLEQLGTPAACVWVSGLDEMTSTESELATYGLAIAEANARKSTLFALYGGFFHVLLTTLGLRGASHGVGYGEHREWRELPQSGQPPARFYVPLLHRYLTKELADTLYEFEPGLVQCACAGFSGVKPSNIPYHKLMEHSVICRQREYETWSVLSPAAALKKLQLETETAEELVSKVEKKSPPRQARLIRLNTLHLARWVSAFRQSIPE